MISNAAFDLESGLEAEFSFTSATKGFGGDGVAFLLVDADQFTPGVDTFTTFGSSFGIIGQPANYLVVALDEGGFHKQFVAGGANQPDNVSVSVNGAAVAGGVADVTPFGVIGGGDRDVRLEISSNGELTMSISFDGGTTFNSIFTDLDIFSGGAAPERFRFGLASSTGGATNDYFIDDLSVVAGQDQVVLAGTDILRDEDRMGITLSSFDAASFNVANASIGTKDDAETAVQSILLGLEELSIRRTDVGAALSVVNGTQATIGLTQLNLSQATSSLVEADIPGAVVDYLKQIVSRATSIEAVSKVHNLERSTSEALTDMIQI